MSRQTPSTPPASRRPGRRSGTFRLLIAPVAAALVAGTALSGCSGSATAASPSTPPLPAVLQGDPDQVLAAAAGRTMTSGNAGITLSTPVVNEGQATVVNGEGAIDFAGNKMKLVVPNAEKAEQLQFGRSLYVLLPEHFAESFGGKKWVKLSLDAAGATSPDPFNLYAYEPSQLLTALTATDDATLVGEEPVRDAKTTHFTGTLTASRVATSGVNPTFAKAFENATGGAATPVEVWLDDEGLVRRATVALPPPNAGPGSGAPVATVELFDFGTADVSFTEPSANLVTDPTALAGLAGGAD